MAEVKTGNGIPSLPLKKPASFNHSSTSYKHIYDDVFASASPLKSRQQSSTFIDDDYAEMFGSSRSNNGTWSISYSSIPVLDLPPPSEMRVRGGSGVTTISGERGGGGEVDYRGVFGGFGDGKFDLPDGEELFDQFNKKTKTSSNGMPRSKVLPMEATKPEILRQSQNGRSPTNVFSQSFDSLQDSERNKSEAAMKKSGEITKAAHGRGFPGAIHKMEEAVPVQTTLSRKIPVIKDDTQLGKDIHLAKKQGKHDRYISLDLGPIVQNENSGFLKESGFSVSNSMKTANETSQSATGSTKSFSQPSDGLTNSFSQPSDITKHFDHTSNNMRNTGTSEAIYEVDVHAIDESTSTLYEIDPTHLSSESSVIKDDTETQMDVNTAEKQDKHSRNNSSELKASKHNSELHAEFLNVSRLSEPFSLDTSRDTCQPTLEAGLSKHSRNNSSELKASKHNSELHAEFHNVSRLSEPFSINTSRDTRQPSLEAGLSKHSRNNSSELKASKHNSELHAEFQNVSRLSEPFSINTSRDTRQPTLEAGLSKHSRNNSSELKASKHNNELHAEFQNVSRLSEPFSLDTSQHTCQPTLEAGLSKTVSDDVPISFDRRKKGRHSRITSLDLGDSKNSREQDGQSQRKPRFGGSYSFDASNDPHAARVKVQPSMMAPSSSVPQFFPVESHYKISKNSSWRDFGTHVYRGASVSPPSLDEQLDTNSAAAVSAAALQRAIEEAAMIIQMAKEYLEREGQGSSKVRFKDTLKVKIAKNEQLEDELGEFRHTIMHEKERRSISERMSVLENGLPSPISEDPKNVYNDVPVVQDQNKFFQDEGSIEESKMRDDSLPLDSEKERLSLSERTSVVESDQPSRISEDPEKFVKYDHIFQDEKKFVEDEGCIEERNPNMSELSDDRDNQEGGGEWEAAKHLNQLICGVKNKIASFMAWQTDTEKKDDPKEKEALQSEREPDLINVENTEIRAAEKNLGDTSCAGEHVEIEIGFLSETVGTYENELFWSNTAGQEQAESSVDLNPVAKAPASANFMFCPFRNEGIHGPTNEENTGSVECTDIEFLSVQEDVMNEIKYEQLHGKCEKHNRKALDDTCTIQDRVDSNIEEINEIVEEPCLLAGKDGNEATDEEDLKRSIDVECREDPIHDSHCPESTTERIDENGYCEEYGVTKETENCQHDGQAMEETILEHPMADSHCPESATERIDENGNCEEYGVTKETENWQHDAQVLEETILEDPIRGYHCPESATDIIDENSNCEEYGVTKETENWQHDAQILEETFLEVKIAERIEATEGIHGCQEIERDQSQINHIEQGAGQMHGLNEFMTEDTLTDRVGTIEEVAEKSSYTDKDVYVQAESSCIEVTMEEMAEEANFIETPEDEHTETEIEHNENTVEQVAQQAACFVTNEDDCQQTENVCLSEAEGPCRNDDSSAGVKEAVSSDEKHDRNMEIPGPSSEPKLEKEETVLFYDSFVELDGITEDLDDDDDETLEVENSVLHSIQSDMYPSKEEIDVNVMEAEFQDILENQTDHVHDYEETLNLGEVNTFNGQEVENSGVDAVQRRRRWFDNGVKVGLAERPSILERDLTELETDQEALDEFILAGSVEIHADELGGDRQEVTYSKDHDPAVNQDSGRVVNSESTPKRRRWSVKIGEEGLPVPPPLFQDINVNLEEPQNIVHSKSESSLDKLNAKSGESLKTTEDDVAVNGGKDKKSVEAAPRRKRWFGSGENVGPGPASQLRSNGDVGITLEIDLESKVKGDIENDKRDNMSTVHETEAEPIKMEPVNDRHLDEVNRKEKERMAVERAIREARERAFAEAKERARRDASERPNVEIRQKVAAGAQERVAKVPAEARVSSDKAAMDAKLRAERAAVERATAEARERALQKSLSEKASHRSREQVGRFPAEKNTSSDPSFQSSSSFSRVDLSNKGEKYEGFDSESAQRRKARSERQNRTMERPATALEEKNRRDLLAQKEQAAKNMMADSLDAEVKRWSAGKEGNLRVMLSTLQYILGPESGWQAVSLTDLIAATAVRKAYKKATLCVHPDKLQQRGATIEQKYICEKVFDLLKDAWSKLNPDER